MEAVVKQPQVYFPSLTAHQEEILEELEWIIKRLDEFSTAGSSAEPDIEATLRKELYECTIQALRLTKRGKDGAFYFHPDLPPLAKHHLLNWVGSKLAFGELENLKAAKIKLKKREKKSLLGFNFWNRVLTLRGIGIETTRDNGEAELESTSVSELPQSVHQILRDLRKSRRVRSHRKLEKKWLAFNRAAEKPKRVRKEKRAWHWVIRRLVGEGYLERPTSHQNFKKMLKSLYPWIDWDRM
jgi:hypothetical protein